MSFSKKVELLLEEKNPSLSSLLFEKKEDDESKDDAALFDMYDEEETKEEESSDDSSSEEETESKDKDDADESDSEEKDDPESEGATQQQIETLTSQIEAIKNTIDKVNKDDGTQSIESFIAGIVSADVNESYSYSNKSIKEFLLTEDDESLENVEQDLDVLDRVLTKGTELVDKFKKGKEINVASYVTAAINAYKNFDNLFAKEKIVKQATINVLVLNSGARAEQNIKEFEELFHEELHRQFGIEYPEYALVTKKYNTATGAVKQG